MLAESGLKPGVERQRDSKAQDGAQQGNPAR